MERTEVITDYCNVHNMYIHDTRSRNDMDVTPLYVIRGKERYAAYFTKMHPVRRDDGTVEYVYIFKVSAGNGFIFEEGNTLIYYGKGSLRLFYDYSPRWRCWPWCWWVTRPNYPRYGAI